MSFFEGNEIIAENLLLSMCTEKSKENRKSALINISPHSNLQALISRSRDKDQDIRETLFRKLHIEKIPIFKFPVSTTYKLIHDAWGSKENNVRKAFLQYLKDCFDNFGSNSNKGFRICIINTLRSLEIDYSIIYPKIYQVLSEIVFEFIIAYISLPEINEFLQSFHSRFGRNKNFDFENEELFFVRVLLSFDSKSEKGESIMKSLDDFMPNGLEICDLMKFYFSAEEIFPFHQVLSIASSTINFDEVSKQRLKTYILEFLSLKCPEMKIFLAENEADNPEERIEFNDVVFDPFLFRDWAPNEDNFHRIIDFDDLIFFLLKIFRKVSGQDSSAFLLPVIQTISEISDENPEERYEEEIDRLQAEIDRLSQLVAPVLATGKENRRRKKVHVEEIDEAESSKELEATKIRLSSLKEIASWGSNRCIKILISLLRLNRTLPTQYLEGIMNNFLASFFSSKSKKIKIQALEAVGLITLIDEKICVEYFHNYTKLFTGNFNMEEDCLAARVIFDLITVYDLLNNDFLDQCEIPIEKVELIEHLFLCLFKGNEPLQKICIEGFCKIIFNKKVSQPFNSILTMLLILCHKSENDYAVQFLTNFFMVYASTSIDAQYHLANALEIYVRLYENCLLKNLEFDESTFSIKINEKEFLKVCKSTLFLISNEIREKFPKEEAGGNNPISPQEQFLLFFIEIMIKRGCIGKFAAFQKIEASFFDFHLQAETNTTNIEHLLIKYNLPSSFNYKLLRNLKIKPELIEIEEEKENCEEEVEIIEISSDNSKNLSLPPFLQEIFDSQLLKRGNLSQESALLLRFLIKNEILSKARLASDSQEEDSEAEENILVMKAQTRIEDRTKKPSKGKVSAKPTSQAKRKRQRNN